jgi:hypothetical protein
MEQYNKYEKQVFCAYVIVIGMKLKIHPELILCFYRNKSL